MFVSDGSWTPLAEVRGMLPEVSAAALPKPAVAECKHDHKSAALDELPWLLDLLGPSGWAEAAGKTRCSRACDPQAPDNESDSEAQEVDVFEVMDALLAKRLELAAAAPVAAVNFRWQLRGGSWTAAHRGMSFDSFMATAIKGGPAEQWCIEWGLTRSGSFAIGLYGEDGAHTMAKYWVALHEWLYLKFLAHESEPGWMFSDIVMAEFEEPAELSVLFAASSLRAQDRISAIRQLRPHRRAT
jgi:hypothetical protein